MIKLVLFLLIANYAYARDCYGNSHVDLTNGIYFENGTIMKDGVYFPLNSVYIKENNGVNTTFGCLCEVKICLKKCCTSKKKIFLDNDKTQCVTNDSVTSVFNSNVKLYNKLIFKKSINLENHDKFEILDADLDCQPYHKNYKKFLQEDGSLYVSMPISIPPHRVFTYDKFCVDSFFSEGNLQGHFDTIACFKTTDEKDGAQLNFYVAGSCMLISCTFMIVTIAVYVFVPELMNLHGRVLIAYLVCLLVSFLFLAITQLMLQMETITNRMCLGFTFIIYFSTEAAFMWMSVMSYDIWRTFSGHRSATRHKRSVRNRFIMYALFAFSITTLLTIILAALEFADMEPHPLLPMIRLQGCFLHGQSKFLYLYIPMMWTCFANITFFALTAIQIGKTTQQTIVLRSEDSKTNKKMNNDKQRFILYVKLFLLMGISWLLEVISFLFPAPKYLWFVVDVYNGLIGVFIFVMFVCKPKILKLIKKRTCQLKEDRASFSTRTTNSTTRSCHDDIVLKKTNSLPTKEHFSSPVNYSRSISKS